MGEFLTLDDTFPNVERKKDHNQPSISNVPVERTFAQMGDFAQKIINEVKKGEIQFINHATSLLCVIASIVRNICLSKLNGIMHPSMVFHHINDGLSDSMHMMKD
jgi:hypothetical protein